MRGISSSMRSRSGGGAIRVMVMAESEEALWAAWVADGIALGPGEFSPGYDGAMELMGDGRSSEVFGWRATLRIYGRDLLAQLREGIAQEAANGGLKPLFQRTRLIQTFNLEKCPAGWCSPGGVVYFESSE